MVTLVEDFAFPGTPHFDNMVEISLAGKEIGLTGLWFADHFTYVARDGSSDELKGCWEAFTLMAGIAAAVPGMLVGPLVACTAYRNPALTAKMAEMIDDISGGRFVLGLGAGWNKREYGEFGYEFEPRVTKFEEAIRIIHPLLRTGTVDFHGTYYRTNHALNAPRSRNPGNVPILIGSTGARMLRSVARYADAWNHWFHDSLDAMPDLLAKLDTGLSAAGRDPSTLVRTCNVSVEMPGYTGTRPTVFKGSAEEIARVLDTLRRNHFRHIILAPDPCTPQAVLEMKEIVAIFHQMAA